MTRLIEVIVAPGGAITVQTRGYVGQECLMASKFLETSLGLTLSEQKSAEFYQTEQARQQVEQ